MSPWQDYTNEGVDQGELLNGTILGMISQAKGAKGKADKLFSQIIRKPGVCSRCGSRDWLQCAHIISRRYSATRCDLRNAWCLCAACHRRLTDWPVDHHHYIVETIGTELYEELRTLAETVTKVNWEKVYQELKKLDSIKALA